MTLDLELAGEEAKSIVALAFRNGPIEECSRGPRLSDMFWKVRILPHNANRNEEDHEEGGGHGLQVALPETERSRKVEMMLAFGNRYTPKLAQRIIKMRTYRHAISLLPFRRDSPSARKNRTGLPSNRAKSPMSGSRATVC
jgi:hypothetical protein